MDNNALLKMKTEPNVNGQNETFETLRAKVKVTPQI